MFVGVAAVPVPVNGALALPILLVVTFSEADLTPAVAGLNVTFIVQTAPTASVPVQVGMEVEKLAESGPESIMVIPVAVMVALLF